MSQQDIGQEEKDAILREWTTKLVKALEVHDLDVDINTVLGLAGKAAHSVLRPAAPLTTFVTGYAAGVAAGSGAAQPDVAVSTAMDTAFELCRDAAAAAETTV